MKQELVDTKKILNLLLGKFSPPYWFSFPELRGGTGYSIDKTIDLFSISKYARDGYGYSIAFEIKISRQDFMNEIRKPEKRKWFVENSHQFYFVCPKNLIGNSEIPTECGLMEAGKRITIEKIAPQRDLEGFSPVFVASLLNRANTGNEEGYSKMFKYAGKELTIDEFEKIVKDKLDLTETDLERKAWEKYKEVFKNKKNDDYKSLVNRINELLKVSWIKGSDYSKEIYSNDRILRAIENLVESSKKINFTLKELSYLKTQLVNITDIIKNKIDLKRDKK